MPGKVAEKRPERIKKAKAAFTSPKAVKTGGGKIRAKKTINVKLKRDPNRIVKLTGGHGVDPTAAANQSIEGMKDNFMVQGMSDKMKVVATMQDQSVNLTAAGFILFAIRKGWMSSIKQGEEPYFAWRYLVDVINSVLNGDAPLIQNAPKALWEFLAAIKPKSAGFKTAQVKYNWKVLTTSIGSSNGPILSLRSAVNPYAICWGQDSATEMVNGLPVLVVPDAGLNPYTQSKGATSFQSCCDFLGNTGMTQLSGDITGECQLMNDTSAFAVCFPELGQSDSTECGVAQTIYSERKIAVPLLSKFATYQPTGEFYRGWQHAGKSAGSVMYVLPRMLEMSCSEKGFCKELYNKSSPMVKFFNFDEYYVELSLTLGKALVNFYNCVGNSGVTTCPLTVQQVQLLLRQSILSIMCNHLGCDLTLGNSFYPMTPFVVGPNGVTLDQTQMSLPTLLCEQIRASCRRQVKLSTAYKEYIMDMIPVLGRPASLDPIGNYTVTILSGQAPGTFDIYSAPGAEMPINIIDLSYVSGGATNYVSLQGSTFSGWLKAWNEWIGQLSGVLSPLTSVGAEPGITALSTVFYTVTQQDVTIDSNIQVTSPVNSRLSVGKGDPEPLAYDPRIKLTPSRRKVQKRVANQKKVKNIGSAPRMTESDQAVPDVPSYIDAWNEKEILCEQKTSAPVMRYIRDFILPSALSTGEANQASLQTWQTFFIEPYVLAKSIAGGLGGDFPQVYPIIVQRLDRLAEYDTKAFSSGDQQNEYISGLLELGKLGRGGFFASVAGGLSNFFLPGTGKFAESAVSSLGL